MQQQYWNQLTQFKFGLYYLGAQFENYVKINRIIKIGVTIASSAAIAAWATWTSLSFLWGLVIVIGHVIDTVNGVLPYHKRIMDISEMLPRLNAVYILAEKKWFDVATGKLTDEEINDLLFERITEWSQIDQEYFYEDVLPKDEKCLAKAEDEKNKYFKNRFGV